MRRFTAKAIASFGVSIVMAAACGSSAPKPVDPVGGVAAAFDAANAGGTLRQMDLVGCLTTGGAIEGAYTSAFGGVGVEALAQAGISESDLSAAWKISFSDLQTSELTKSGDTATVHVVVKVTSEVDAAKMRELVKKYAATQGIVPDDATIDAAILSKLGGALTQSETITKDVSVTQQGGTWTACGSGSTAMGSTAPAATAATTPAAAATPAATTAAGASGAPAATGQATAIVAGSGHLCALLSDGGVMCWGSNSQGQLGNGSSTTDSAAAPVQVSGLANGVTDIVGAGTYTCALTNGGAVKCWGTGAVGNGSSAPTTSPADIVGLENGVRDISAGAGHACSVTGTGGVKCWGRNASGQLGDGTKTDSAVPVDAAGLASGVAAVAAGFDHTCALTTGGGVKCWGANSSGQLGNGSTTASAAPVDVVGLTTGVSAITAGQQQTCALTTGGAVKCWGSGSSIPVDVAGLTSGISAVYATGAGVSCAAASAGGLKCWTGSGANAADIKDVPGIPSGVRSVAIGGQDTQCVLATGGTVSCYGSRDGTWTDVTGLGASSGSGSGPAPAPGTTGGTTALTMGLLHTCALTSGGGVKCSGTNMDGQLGDGSVVASATPVAVVGLDSGATTVSAGDSYTCAVTNAGGVKCWGGNREGELGTGTTANSTIPVDVQGLTSGVGAVDAGDRHACALTTGGAIACWGDNPYGELGNGSTTGSTTPVKVTGLAGGVTDITTSRDATCAIAAGGAVMCWGYNQVGQLGTGSKAMSQPVPAAVAGLTGATDVALGDEFACAVTGTGGARCWGVGPVGQLGNGSTAMATSPVDVVGLGSGVRTVATGKDHACALTSDGAVKCWGGNGSGQLGNGTTANSLTPVDVAGLSSGIVAITAGNLATCAVSTDGAVKCWGGSYGTTPANVAGL